VKKSRLFHSIFGLLALAACTATAAAAAPASSKPAAKPAVAAPAEDGWVALFNGKDLTGWKVLGGKADFKVVNGEIVGTIVVGNHNTFLCTEKNYADFILELEYNCPEEINSGVQIRSEWNEERREVKDIPALPRQRHKQVFSGPKHVSGYQVEIEFRPGRTAGIYDEDRRHTWVSPHAGTAADEAFRKQGRDRSIVKPGEWQKLRVEARGTSMRTYLDGVLRADAQDSASATGLIGLQVHAAPKRDAGKSVRFRNIRIKELHQQPAPAAK
jgi:hypothetical protein